VLASWHNEGSWCIAAKAELRERLHKKLETVRAQRKADERAQVASDAKKWRDEQQRKGQKAAQKRPRCAFVLSYIQVCLLLVSTLANFRALWELCVGPNAVGMANAVPDVHMQIPVRTATYSMRIRIICSFGKSRGKAKKIDKDRIEIRFRFVRIRFCKNEMAVTAGTCRILPCTARILRISCRQHLCLDSRKSSAELRTAVRHSRPMHVRSLV
jgi:hypothetical protein